MSIQRIMERAPVIPVLAVTDVEQAVPLGRALVAGGLPIIEITLRTEAALSVIEAIDRHVEGATVGAGTLRAASQFEEVRDAGARFAVGPGATESLFAAAERTGLDFLPGVVTPADVLRAGEAGWQHLKFFPAEAFGGVKTLQSLQGPFPDVRFCPTGGVNGQNYLDYLALDNVLCVGGSWVAPQSLVDRGDWGRITELAGHASGLNPPHVDAAWNDDPNAWSSLGEEDPGAATEELYRDR
jgi:2-dehydro-3-deoxyphosphogluconate aldolase/(4S)-4-hydroxy-2-oxoglutarate aldolase